VHGVKNLVHAQKKKKKNLASLNFRRKGRQRRSKLAGFAAAAGSVRAYLVGPVAPRAAAFSGRAARRRTLVCVFLPARLIRCEVRSSMHNLLN
jgi:hypothetical protein